MSSLKIQLKKFSELSTPELYDILKLRFNVFVLEQNCIYHEYDELDHNALHLFIEKEDTIIAYSRIYLKNSSDVHLGRVVVHEDFRKKGLAKKLVAEVIKYTKSNLKAPKIKISAQEYLKDFYEPFGFKQISEVYDDAGIPHVDMSLSL